MINTLTQVTNHKEVQRFARFSVVGAAGTVIDFGLLIAGKELLGLPTILANVLSFSAGTLNSFTLNRLWTYADSRRKLALVQLGQFAAVSVIGLALNTSLVLALETLFDTWMDGAGTGYLLAKVIATGVVLMWNFAANRLWTFNDVQ